METLLYLLKVNVAIAVFYLMYKLFYRDDTFFTMRRYLMQSMLVLAVSYPFLDFSQWMIQNQTLTEIAISYTNILPEISIPSSVEIITPESGRPLPASFSIMTYLLWSYSLITGFLLLRLLFRIGFIVWIRLHSQTVSIENIRILNARKKITPFSFFTWIFINPDIHNDKELHEILMHERVHTRQYHSIDILMSECICALCWINPMA